jgi:toxin YoeB
MADKKIVWSDLAKLELATTLKFYLLQNGNPNYSLKLLSQIEDLLVTLSKSELIGRLTSNKSTRVISMKVYSLFYEINNDRIEIVSFWDNRQNADNRKVK